MNKKKVFIIAGEASGDIIGADLINSINEIVAAKGGGQSIEYFAVGGDKISKLDVTNIFSSYDLSVVGLVEVFTSVPRILRRISQTVKSILLHKPDVIVTIDSPGFNFRLVKRLRKKEGYGKGDGVLMMHYVAPMVWAENHGRVQVVGELFDHIFLLFPFEARYFSDIPYTVVGHSAKMQSDGNGDDSPAVVEQSDDDILITVMIGSRKIEVDRHFPVLYSTMMYLRNLYGARGKRMQFFLPLRPHMKQYLEEHYRSDLEECGDMVYISDDDTVKNSYIAASKCALLKSGTCTLEVAALGVPIICFYRVSWFTALFFRKERVNTRFFALPNILLQKRVVAELIQNDFNVEKLSSEVISILENKDVAENQIRAFKELFAITSVKNDRYSKASDIAASVLLDYLEL